MSIAVDAYPLFILPLTISAQVIFFFVNFSRNGNLPLLFFIGFSHDKILPALLLTSLVKILFLTVDNLVFFQNAGCY